MRLDIIIVAAGTCPRIVNILTKSAGLARLFYMAIIAAIGIVVAWKQLSNLRKELRMNSLMAVLEIETEMNTRKEKLDNIAFNIRKLDAKNKLTKELKEIFHDERECALENYLNSLDRLSFCILKKYLDDKDWKTEYRDYLSNVVRENESKFGQGSRYTNIIDLNNKWKRE